MTGRSSLTLEELHVLSYLDQLPKKVPFKQIVRVFIFPHPCDDLFGMYIFIVFV